MGSRRSRNVVGTERASAAGTGPVSRGQRMYSIGSVMVRICAQLFEHVAALFSYLPCFAADSVAWAPHRVSSCGCVPRRWRGRATRRASPVATVSSLTWWTAAAARVVSLRWESWARMSASRRQVVRRLCETGWPLLTASMSSAGRPSLLIVARASAWSFLSARILTCSGIAPIPPMATAGQPHGASRVVLDGGMRRAGWSIPQGIRRRYADTTPYGTRII